MSLSLSANRSKSRLSVSSCQWRIGRNPAYSADLLTNPFDCESGEAVVLRTGEDPHQAVRTGPRDQGGGERHLLRRQPNGVRALREDGVDDVLVLLRLERAGHPCDRPAWGKEIEGGAEELPLE